MDDSILSNDDNTITNTNTLLNNITGNSASNVSPLEQEVLDEYSRLLENMNQLSETLSTLASGPMTAEIADGLRLLERKVTSVYTLMKASVYSIVLQQGQMDGDDGDGNGYGEGNTTIGQHGFTVRAGAGAGAGAGSGADGASRLD